MTHNKTHKLVRVLRKRFSGEHGFSMIPAMTAVMVGSLLSMGAWTAAHADIKLQNTDRYEKLAYSQAESGVTDYVQKMAEDSGYWSNCDAFQGLTGTGQGQTAVNDTDRSGTSGAKPRRWLPYAAANTTSDAAITAQYTIDLVPVNGYSSCKGATVRTESMIDKTTGTIRIRVTGRAGPPAPSTSNVEAWRASKWKKRSIVVEFRRKGFLDYAYFTDRESRDPALYPVGDAKRTDCAKYYTPASTDAASNPTGRYYYNGTGSPARSNCTEIMFADTDTIEGPFHTNDSVLLQSSSNNATFGRNAADAMEVFDDRCPFRTSAHAVPLNQVDSNTTKCPPLTGSGSIRPRTNGGAFRFGAQAGYLPLPESNADLKIYADPNNVEDEYRGYTFHGTTKVVLRNDGKIDVWNADETNGGTGGWETMVYPTSGVLYVDNEPSVASCDFDPTDTYSNALPAGCALLEVSGTYDTSVTLASASDIVITGNIYRSTTNDAAVLGMIADKFVRVRHYYQSTGCGEGTGTKVTQINAAILALQHSFTVDQYDCGSGLGTLTVNGVLAQAYRGAVGTGTGSTGYIKDYNYDNRFKGSTPPHFLTPTLSTWKISRYREQVPACACT